MDEIRWGILGSGYVAGNFANGLRYARGSVLHAVASRRIETAASFAAEHGPTVVAHDSYESLVADPRVDVVYVATPNECHVEHSLLAIAAGKHVLCEKPMALDQDQSRRIFDAARARGVFCMEGMWMRCSPAVRHVLAAVNAGVIGEPRFFAAQLGNVNVPAPSSRLFAPPGGGALLDLGVYLVSFAHAVFGAPVKIAATAVIGSTGVDEQVSMLLSYSGGRQATLTASLVCPLTNASSLHGTRGLVCVDAPLYFPESYSLTRVTPQALAGRAPRVSGLRRLKQAPLLRPAVDRLRALKTLAKSSRVRLPPHGTGLSVEAEEVARCLRAGLKESPLVPQADSLAVMGILDTVRHNWTHF